MNGPELLLFAIFAPLILASIGIPFKERVKGILTTLGAFIAALIISWLAINGTFFEKYSWDWIPDLGLYVSVRFIPYSMIMGLVVSWIIFLIFLYSIKYMEGDYRPGWYWWFMGFFATSMLIIVFAENLLFLLFGWEGVGLASWGLIGHWYRDEEEYWVGEKEYVAKTPYWWPPSLAGLRAILTVRLGDAPFMVALAYILVGTAPILGGPIGTLSLVELSEIKTAWINFEYVKLLPLILIMFAMGPFTKSAQFPFYEWLLTAMTGPTSVSALIHAATMVKAGVYLLLIFAPIMLDMYMFGEPGVLTVFWVFAIIGALTALMTTMISTSAQEFKLVLAGSTAANLGLLTMIVGVGGVLYHYFYAVLHQHELAMAVFTFALFAGLAHIMAHACAKASLFLGYGAVIHEIHSRFIRDAGGLGKFMRITYIAMLLAMLSLVGIPPFVGFFTKEAVISPAYLIGCFALTGMLILTIFLTPIYGFRLIGLTFLHEPAKERHVEEAHPVMLVPYTILAIAGIVLGIYWYLGLEHTVMHAAIEYLPLHVAHPFHPEPWTMAISLTALVAGLIIGLYFYIFRRFLIPTGILWKISYHRFYLPVAYDLGLTKLYWYISHGVFKGIDQGFFDNIYHRFFPWLFGKSSILFRRLQYGPVNAYVLYALIGLLLILILVWWFT